MVIIRNIFKSDEQRRQELKDKRRAMLRQLERAGTKYSEMAKKFERLGRAAASQGDEERVRSCARGVLVMGQRSKMAVQKRNYLNELDITIDMAALDAGFAQMVNETAQTMTSLLNASHVREFRTNIDKAAAAAERMDDRLSLMLDSGDDLWSAMGCEVDADKVEEMMSALRASAPDSAPALSGRERVSELP